MHAVDGVVVCDYCASDYERVDDDVAELLYGGQTVPFVEGVRKKRVEHVVIEKLEESFEEMGCIAHTKDVILESGCSRKRPDSTLLFEGVNVVVEVDERQHRSYDKDCEDQRMKQVKQDIACAFMPESGAALPTVFIRFNPDKCAGRRNADGLEVRIAKLKKMVAEGSRMRRDAVWYMYYDAYDHERVGFFDTE